MAKVEKNHLEKMSVSEIISKTNLCFTPDSLLEIWLQNIDNVKIKKTYINPEGLNAIDLLRYHHNGSYPEELVDNMVELKQFLIEHEDEIDKPKLLVVLIENYKQVLNDSVLMKVSPQRIELYKNCMKNARDLLKGIDRTIVFLKITEEAGQIEDLLIIDTNAEAQGKERKRKPENIERIKKFDFDQLENIIGILEPADIQGKLAYKSGVGSSIRYLIEYNVLLKNNNKRDFLKLINDYPLWRQQLDKLDKTEILKEMFPAILYYIEEIDIDKLLLVSALRYVQAMEEFRVDEKDNMEVFKVLQCINNELAKDAKVDYKKNGVKVYYNKKTLEEDMQRFVTKGQDIKYFSYEKCEELKKEIIEGKCSLNDLELNSLEILQLSRKDIVNILKDNPENYMFFLKQENCPYEKEQILKDIIAKKECSKELLDLICEKTNITADEICELFDKDLISVGDLLGLKENFSSIITDKKLFEKYQNYKNKVDDEEARIQLERYSLAYRNLELIGKTDIELEQKGEDFVTSVGEEIEQEDLIQLYGLDIIPLKVAVDWGGEDIIEELLENENLKPADARTLRDKGLLDEKVLERLFRTCKDMSYSYQVSLVYEVFDKQTAEEHAIRERLAQYYHIEQGLSTASKKKNFKKRKNEKENTNIPEDLYFYDKIKMRDPGAKYNLLASFDKDVKIEEGIVDGHIIFHYPNIDGGTVLIEKLHKISTDRETGMIVIRADNESATYVMSEEEFIKLKGALIDEDGKIDRTVMTQRWWFTRDPEHWIAHSGMSGWENSLKQRFNINEENSRYSEAELKHINDLMSKSIESKKGEER